ncbi:MAG: hypothetical protein K2G55_06470 [Lachnospiraceae bacterium]|nr:hypothetical protein [Lachnospiraceae bacterium]
MNKYIEKVEQYKQKTLNNALEKLRAEYREAQRDYADSGYDRYFNKMNRCEKQIDEIEEYLRPKRKMSPEEFEELNGLRRTVKTAKNKVFYLLCDWPEELVNTELTSLRDLLSRYNY